MSSQFKRSKHCKRFPHRDKRTGLRWAGDRGDGWAGVRRCVKTRGPLHSARWSGGLGRLGPLGAGGRSRLVAGLGGALVPTRGDGLVAGHGLPTTPAPPSSTSSSLLLTLPLFSIHTFPFPPPPSPTRPILLLFLRAPVSTQYGATRPVQLGLSLDYQSPFQRAGRARGPPTS